MADSKSAYTTIGADISYTSSWIATESLHSIAHNDHDNPLLHDVLSLHGLGQLFVIQRSHRTCTSRFLWDDYSSHHSEERCDVRNRSSPWTPISMDRIRLSSVYRCPPSIDSSWLWDRQWSLWQADCCSGWQSSDRRIALTMNTPKSPGNCAWSITFDPYTNSLPAQSIICSMTRIIGNMYHEYNPRKSFNFAKQAFCNTFIHYHGRIASIK